MSKESLAWIVLLGLAVAGWFYSAQHAAYLEGRESVYRQSWIDFKNQEVGTCYAKGGCHDDDELYSVSESDQHATPVKPKARKK